MTFVSLLVFSPVFGSLKGAKILRISSMPSHSHFVLAIKLLTELTLRGHEVTMIGVYKNKKDWKNYKKIVKLLES